MSHRLFPADSQIFAVTIARAAHITDDIHIGTMIEYGLSDPAERLSVIRVVGMRLNDAVPRSVNIAMSAVVLKGCGLTESSSRMAESAYGVAALPIPSRLAEIQETISRCPLPLFQASGKIRPRKGDMMRQKRSRIPESLNTSITPHQKQAIPHISTDNETLLAAPSMTAFVSAPKFSENIAQISENRVIATKHFDIIFQASRRFDLF